ncbi:MAG: cysteine desulfurase [Propionibacteriaceae bacterium]|jgi:cysteine desulfurase/selenocysteine lyase|nr:cysteine desulfurase [Propionibacteriaceae bacterium]
MIDWSALRQDFPILTRRIAGRPLVYLDSANTAQKPRAVVDAMAEFSLNHNANIARAMHTLGVEATSAYESARETVAKFIGAAPSEVIFTKNASESLNLAAHSLGAGLKSGDEVVISVAEHHSNIVPWQLLCQRSGARLRWFDVDDQGQIDLDGAKEDGLINDQTKIVSITAMSNVTGVASPVNQIAAWAHDHGAIVLADGAQLVPHSPVDVAALGVDLLAFTGHKLLGPTGIGVLWGRYDLLADMPPFLGGGEMIELVTMERSTYAAPPHRFEAGTSPIAQAVGLAAGINYLEAIGMSQVETRLDELTAYALGRLAQVPHLRILGPDHLPRGGAVAFTLADIHPHDVMQVLDSYGVAVRGGHHCARPLHQRLGIQASVRASMGLYNTEEDIDTLVEALLATLEFFKVSPGDDQQQGVRHG